jgi:hypothetical protein
MSRTLIVASPAVIQTVVKDLAAPSSPKNGPVPSPSCSDIMM